MAHVIRWWETTILSQSGGHFRMQCDEPGCLLGTVSGSPAESIRDLLHMAELAHEAEHGDDPTPGQQADEDRAAGKVPEPTACALCHGARRVAWADLPPEPCPACCCAVCGQQVTDTPPVCGSCDAAEDAAAIRRADRAPD